MIVYNKNLNLVYSQANIDLPNYDVASKLLYVPKLLLAYQSQQL